jgi:hypothetical protein
LDFIRIGIGVPRSDVLKATQLSFDYASEEAADTGKGL